MRKTLISIVALTALWPVQRPEAKELSAGGLEWLSTTYDFGVMKESDGKKTGEVKFINRGKEATIINAVRPSCGCTGASYNDGLIEPGDTATVSFTYNPVGRPGKFDKTVKIYTGVNNDLMTIRIMGTVIGTPATLDRDFPATIGDLRLSTLEEKAGDITYGSARHLFVRIYNQSENTIYPKIVDMPAAISGGITPEALPPGEVGTIGLYVNTRDTGDMGAMDYGVRIEVCDSDGVKQAEGTLHVGAVIVPDTSAMSVEDIDKAPYADVIPQLIDFSKEEIKNPKKCKFKFRILNDGGSPLEVLRVYSRDGSVKITRQPSKVKAGKNALVEGTVDTTAFGEGAWRLGVEVVTNDPLHPVRTVTIVGIKR